MSATLKNFNFLLASEWLKTLWNLDWYLFGEKKIRWANLHSKNTLNLYFFFFVTKQMVDFHIIGLVHRDVLYTLDCVLKWLHYVQIAPCKAIRIPESRNFLLVESGILGFGIQNPAQGTQNPYTKDWPSRIQLTKDPLQIGLSYSLERKTSYGKPPQGICLNVMTCSLISAYLVSKPYFTSSLWRSRSRSAREPLLMSGWEDHKIRGFPREYSAAFLRYKLDCCE